MPLMHGATEQKITRILKPQTHRELSMEPQIVDDDLIQAATQAELASLLSHFESSEDFPIIISPMQTSDLQEWLETLWPDVWGATH